MQYDVARESGYDFPPPRTFDQLVSDPEVKLEMAGAPLIAVPFAPANDPEVEVRVSLDPRLLDAIDEAAREREQTRSVFLAEAVRAHLPG